MPAARSTKDEDTSAVTVYNHEAIRLHGSLSISFKPPPLEQEDIMSNGAEAAALAAIAQAVKASGVLVRLKPEEFLKVLKRIEAPMVVVSPSKFFSRKTSYLTSYKGLAFFTKSLDRFPLPGGCEVIAAGSIWIPR